MEKRFYKWGENLIAKLILRPYSDYDEIWGKYPDTGYRWEKVDEATPNGDTDYIYTNTPYSGARFNFDIAAYVGWNYTINSVKHIMKYKYSGDPAGCSLQFSLRVYISGAYRNWAEGKEAPSGGAGSYHTREAISTKESWFGNPWTWAYITRLNSGPSVYNFGALNYLRVTQYYIEIDYTPVAPTISGGGGGGCSCDLCDQIYYDSIVCCACIDDDGGGNITEVGFEYGETEESTWCVRQTGNDLGTGEYRLTIGQLKPETEYHIRFFATNEIETVYTNWGICTTKAAPSYGVYEEDNTATICFYVRTVGGKWSIKHGPYTTDQIDIEITKILTEGKGKYQIKFTSDVLTGLSVSIMTKLDIKAR